MSNIKRSMEKQHNQLMQREPKLDKEKGVFGYTKYRFDMEIICYQI